MEKTWLSSQDSAQSGYTGLSGGAPDSVWWRTRLSGVPAEQRLPAAPTAPCGALNARACAGLPIPVHRTSNSACPVCTGHPGGPTSQKLQRLESNGSDDVAGAPDCPVCTGLSGAPSNRSLQPTVKFGGWGYKYPNHPTIHCIQVFHFSTTTRALAFNSRHTKEIKSSPIPHKALVTSESDLPCSFELLRLDCFFSFSLALEITTPL